MITVQQLLDNGYVAFDDQTKLGNDWHRGSYQKAISDRFGTRYFINISHSIVPPKPLLGQFGTVDIFTPDVQFRRDESTCNVTLLFGGESLAKIEAFFAEMWERMRFDSAK